MKKQYEILNELYGSPRWQQVRRRVFRRDGVKCLDCGSRDSELHCHHIIPARTIPFKRFYDEDNLATLCRDCHKSMHGQSFSSRRAFGLLEKVQTERNGMNSKMPRKATMDGGRIDPNFKSDMSTYRQKIKEMRLTRDKQSRQRDEGDDVPSVIDDCLDRMQSQINGLQSRVENLKNIINNEMQHQANDASLKYQGYRENRVSIKNLWIAVTAQAIGLFSLIFWIFFLMS